MYRSLNGESLDARHHDLATFAWLEFIALNAPVGDVRGEPDGSFADSGFDPTATLVWETFHHRSEQFPFGDGVPVPPQPWNDPPKYVYQIEGTEYITPFSNYNNLDETTQIGQNAIFFPGMHDDPAAQILFEAKVNQVESDYVASFYDDDGILVEAITLPITLPDNTLEVKAAWVSLDAIPEDEHYRYHTSEVIIYEGTDENPVATVETRALLGLHIIQKTPNYPAFIFATFEHVDLLESQVTGDATDVYYVPTYEAIAYELPETTTFSGLGGEPVDNPVIRFDVDAPTARPRSKWLPLPVGPVEDNPGAEVVGDDVLVPVVQPPTTNGPVAKANKQVLKDMAGIPGFDDSFVWQYYFLKGVQGVPTSKEKANDYYLANIVIESSRPGIQLFRGGISTTTDEKTQIRTLTNRRNQSNVVDEMQDGEPFSVGGCQGCHGIAQTAAGFDFSFLYGARDGKGFSPDTVGEVSAETQQKRASRNILEQIQRGDQ
jgi:hypothetical protein